MYAQGVAPLLALLPRPAEEAAALQAAVRDAGWQRVVDLGAGVGASALALAALGCSVRAVEPDAEMAAVLMARLSPALQPHLAWLPASTGIADGWADGVLCQSVLHLLDTPAQDALLAEAHRVLRPGGALWLELPLASSARAPMPWRVSREAEVGGLRLQLHFRMDRGEGAGWFSDWRFELWDGTRCVHQAERHWDWTPVAPDALRERLAAAGWHWQGAFADWAAQQAFDPAQHTYGFVRLVKG